MPPSSFPPLFRNATGSLETIAFCCAVLIRRGMHTHCATTGMHSSLHPKEPHTAQVASEFDAKGNVNLREPSQHVSGRQTKFPEGMEYDRPQH